MDEQQQSLRTNLALVIIMLLTVGYFYWSGAFNPKPAGTGLDGGQELALADAGSQQLPTPAPQQLALADGGMAADGGMVAQAPAAEIPLMTVERSRAQTNYVFSNEGAGIVSAELLGKKMREQAHLSVEQGYQRLLGKDIGTPPQMNLAEPVAGGAVPLAVTVTGPGGATLLSAQTRYEVVNKGGDESRESTEVTFKGRENGLELTKKLSWQKEGFELHYSLTFTNTTQAPMMGEYALEYSRAIDPAKEEAPSFMGGVGNQSRAACYVNDKLEKVVPKGDYKTEEFKGPISYVGIDQQYFLSAIFTPTAAKEGRCVLTASPTMRKAVAYFPLTLKPGETVTQEFGAFLGPKEVDLLASVPSSQPGVPAAPGGYSPHLEKTVDFGIWAVLCKVLLAILKAFHSLTSNWGVSIILLTIVVKLVLLPLTHKSLVAAENMKKLQPKMNAIREKYKEDKERQNAEMMKLYQEAKVNPLGGCLPMLLQMPVWIALYATLRNDYDIYQEPFFAPLYTDLTFKDPTYLLPLLLGITMIMTQRLQPQMTMDQAQAKMMVWVMPIFFTAIMLNYPAGLTLYIFTNNVLSIAQQWGLKKWIARNPPATA